MCSAPSARANGVSLPTPPPSTNRTRGSLSVATASTPASFSGWASCAAPTTRTRKQAGAGLVDAGGPGDGGDAGRERDGALGFGRLGLPSRSRRRRACAGAVGQQAHGQLERGVRVDLVGRGQAFDGDVALVARAAPACGRRRARRGRRRARRRRAASPLVASPSEISSRRGMPAGSKRPVPRPIASARSVAAPPGASKRVDRVARRPSAGGAGATTSSGVAAKRTTRTGMRAAEACVGAGACSSLRTQGARRREVAVGDAVGDVDQRDRRDGAGVAPHRRLRERERQRRPSTSVRSTACAMRSPRVKSPSDAARHEEQRGRDREQPEPARARRARACSSAMLGSDERARHGRGHDQTVHRR